MGERLVLGEIEEAVGQVAPAARGTAFRAMNPGAGAPFALPPGWLRLGTIPSLTGSPPISNTMGIVVVADFAASAVEAPPGATITAI
jgi:hypothetical protein